MTHSRVILDTISTAKYRYTAPPNRAAGENGLVSAFAHDSTLFVDLPSRAMLVLGASGDVGRVMAIPGAPAQIMVAAGGWIGLDAQGRFVWSAPIAWGRLADLPRDTVRHTTALIRTNARGRSFDTLATVRIGAVYPTGSLILNPL
ncbi:MAG TPA: hypothetical protein VMH39_05485, partial [Gemmatimonadaceae bacterium]|nr:hypothetical protein [Gemmatimonadaceae bacterium]